MRLILLKDISGVGRRDSVVEVSDGYAQNALIPKGLAVQASSRAEALLEERLRQARASAERAATALSANLMQLDGKRVTIQVRANEKGHLFRAITKKDIGREIGLQLHVVLGPEVVRSDEPIKEVGERWVDLAAAGAKARIQLIIEAI